MAHEGFTIFSLNIFYPIWYTFTYFDSYRVFFDYDFFALIKKKNIFLVYCFTFIFQLIFDFQNLSRALDFSHGVYGFWFSKWDRYGSYPRDSFSSGWSAILKARTLRHLSWPNETEDVVWVRSFLLLDGLPAKDKEPHLPEPDIPQVTRSLKQT